MGATSIVLLSLGILIGLVITLIILIYKIVNNLKSISKQLEIVVLNSNSVIVDTCIQTLVQQINNDVYSIRDSLQQISNKYNKNRT